MHVEAVQTLGEALHLTGDLHRLVGALRQRMGRGQVVGIGENRTPEVTAGSRN